MGRHSKCEPYADVIAELMESGCTYAQIEEELWARGFEDANICSIYRFCHSRKLKSKVTKGARDGRYIPTCDGCESCRDVVNTTGKTVWICMQLMQLISKSVKTSPMECPKRRKSVESEKG